MEVGTLRPGQLIDRALPSSRATVEWTRSRTRAFWILAGITTVAAGLRFATLGVQSYHHDEIVTASRLLREGFGHAMSAVWFSESTPPVYYAIAWVWTQLVGTGEWGLRSISALAGVLTVPVAYKIGVELRGRRAGLWVAALVAVNPMMLWYSQEARAYALVVLFGALSALYWLRAERDGAERSDYVRWGIWSGLAIATHYFVAFPILAETLMLLRRRGLRESLAGMAILAGSVIAVAPVAIHQMSLGHAEWISKFGLGHRLWETTATFLTGETSDVIGRPEYPWLVFLPLALVLAALALLLRRSEGRDRRAAARPLLLFAAAIGLPLVLVALGEDFFVARNLIPALVPLLAAVGIAIATPGARRLGTAIGTLLVAYSLGFCVLASADEEFQRPNWSAVAEQLGEPSGPRAMVTWTVGEAPLRYYLSTGSFQVRAQELFDWQVKEIDFISDGQVAPPPRQVLGPGFREVADIDTGRLYIRRYRFVRPGLGPLRLGRLRQADLDFRTTGTLLDGVGPS